VKNSEKDAAARRTAKEKPIRKKKEGRISLI
jgi:hypothetical protein